MSGWVAVIRDPEGRLVAVGPAAKPEQATMILLGVGPGPADPTLQELQQRDE
jgi:hypothetical protein